MQKESVSSVAPLHIHLLPTTRLVPCAGCCSPLAPRTTALTPSAAHARIPPALRRCVLTGACGERGDTKRFHALRLGHLLWGRAICWRPARPRAPGMPARH
jgi:hypothetical protein